MLYIQLLILIVLWGFYFKMEEPFTFVVLLSFSIKLILDNNRNKKAIFLINEERLSYGKHIKNLNKFVSKIKKELSKQKNLNKKVSQNIKWLDKETQLTKKDIKKLISLDSKNKNIFRRIKDSEKQNKSILEAKQSFIDESFRKREQRISERKLRRKKIKEKENVITLKS